MASKWTASRRAKFEATIARKRNGHNSAASDGTVTALKRKRLYHLEAAAQIQKVITLLERI